MNTVFIQSLRHHGRRYLASITAVALAISFIIAISAFGAAAKDGAKQDYTSQIRGDYSVSAKMDLTSFQDSLTAINGLPDVESSYLAGRFFYNSVNYTSGQRFDDIGTVSDNATFQWQKLVEGRYPNNSNEILIDAQNAKGRSTSLGDIVTVGPDRVAFTVVGTVERTMGPFQAHVYIPESAIPRLATPENEFYTDSVLVKAVPGASGVQPALEASLESTLGGASDDGFSFTVQTADERVQSEITRATEDIDVFQRLLMVFAGIALFAGAVVISNAFTIVLAQRTQEFALLRAIGAEKRQIFRSVRREALVVGAVGSVVGIAAGYLVALLGVWAIQRFSPDFAIGTPSLTATAIAVPVIIGMLVTMIAAQIPARRASQQSPIEAQRDDDHQRPVSKVRIGLGVAIVTLGVFLMYVGKDSSILIAMAGGFVSFIGVLLTAPVWVTVGLKTFGKIGGIFGSTGRLATSNAMRNPRRTASTITALLLGVTLISTTMIGLESSKAMAARELDANFPIDVQISTDGGESVKTEIDATTLDAITAVEGVGSVSVIPIFTLPGGETYGVLPQGALDHIGENNALHSLKADQVATISRNEDSVAIDSGNGQVTAATLYAGWIPANYLGLDGLINTDTLTQSSEVVWVSLDGNRSARDVEDDLRNIVQSADYDMRSTVADRDMLKQAINILLTVTLALLAISMVIAVVGVGNTLGLSVIERTRENGVLRALGLERGSLKAMLRIEAIVMALIASVAGVALGVLYGWFGLNSLTQGLTERSFPITIPWTQILGVVVVTLIAAVVAATLPARRAAKVTPVEGISSL